MCTDTKCKKCDAAKATCEECLIGSWLNATTKGCDFSKDGTCNTTGTWWDMTDNSCKKCDDNCEECLGGAKMCVKCKAAD